MSRRKLFTAGFPVLRTIIVVVLILIAGGLILNKVLREEKRISDLEHPPMQKNGIETAPVVPADETSVELELETVPSDAPISGRSVMSRKDGPATRPDRPAAQRDQSPSPRDRATAGPPADMDVIGTIDRVMDALDSHDPDIREEALEALMNIDDDAVNLPLLKALEDENPDVKERAMDVMAYIDSPTVLPALERAILDPDEDIRFEGLSTLEDIEDPRVMDILKDCLEHNPYPDTREDCLDSIEWVTE